MRCQAVLVIISSLLIALSGCTSRQVSGSASPAASTTTAGVSPIPLTSGRGSALIGRNAVDPKDLGLPLYPGAIPAETGALLMHSKNGVSRVISLSTKDGFDKVYDWYKQQMPARSEQAHMAVPNGSVASFLIGRAQDADTRSVLITQSRDKTAILLTRQTKTGKKTSAVSP